MRSHAVELVGLSLFIFNHVSALPAQPKEEPEYIPAGTGLTYPPDDAESSSELTSLMKKINNWDTPLLEGDCSPYPDMKGIKVEPDTADAFQDSEEFHKLASDATTPDGYTPQYTDLHGAINYGAEFLGGTILSEYDPGSCAALCDLYDGCHVFNILAMRVPSLRLNHTDCPNPPSMTAYGCSVWAGKINEKPTIGRSYWADFQLAVAASNIYVRSEESDGPLEKRDCNGAPVILNGGFEVDDPATAITPSGWSLSNIEGTVTFGLTKPGNGESTYAFVASLKPKFPEEEELTGSSFMLSQKLNTCAGQSYKITLDFRYDSAAEGACLFSNGIIGTDENALDYDGETYARAYSDGTPLAWYNSETSFKAIRPNEVLVIFVGCKGNVTNTYSVDNVVVTPFGQPY